ncbi:MAG: hypothetical protein EPGJADBJ_01255 [Saprospiraceae bacterium]|nr:hypothetical protein [Saprospiraceae bacterium]
MSAFKPDIILIEGPPDAEMLIPAVSHPEMQPPVAMLVFNPKDLDQASFFPFAEFSPEWQAMLFGLNNRIPVRFMDLPMSLAFGLKEAGAQQTFDFQENRNASEVADPFAKIAALAGYSDPERWWDAMVERFTVDGRRLTIDGIFPVIHEVMCALRENKTQPETRETLLREAFMRQTIRTAQKDGFSKIAVVCGAWHSPALADLDKTKASADAALLKGLKKVKTEATWIPWSFDRLAAQSGYSAGVVAPAWYRTLWIADLGLRIADSTPSALDNPQSAIPNPQSVNPQSYWFVQAARLLRDKDFAVSPAHVIEAVRLAENLATLRNTALPGIEELREAAVTVLCNGAEKPLELIDQQLVIGDVLGAVPSGLPVPPLKEDFEKQVKSCRLEKNTQEKTLELDLREEAHLRKSRLLHRLDLLGITWGKEQAVGSGKQGRFHEHWQLKWLPDYEIRLIEAGTWGNTVEDAASRRAWRRVHNSESLPELTRLLGMALKADLPAIVPDLLHKLQNISALAKDALLLADAVLPLAEVLRYGSARQLNLGAVQQLLGRIIPRVCVQLPAACTGVDEEVAAEILKKILAVNHAIGILQVVEYEEAWTRTLLTTSQMNTAAPLLTGLTARLLFDKGVHSAAQTGDAMRFYLSHAQAPVLAAQWLEGFLYGSGLLLLHHAELWQTLDGWVRDLPEEHFNELLPLLRRTFSQFSAPERQKMLDIAKNETRQPLAFQQVDEWDIERAEKVLALVRGILQG